MPALRNISGRKPSRDVHYSLGTHARSLHDVSRALRRSRGRGLRRSRTLAIEAISGALRRSGGGRAPGARARRWSKAFGVWLIVNAARSASPARKALAISPPMGRLRGACQREGGDSTRTAWRTHQARPLTRKNACSRARRRGRRWGPLAPDRDGKDEWRRALRPTSRPPPKPSGRPPGSEIDELLPWALPYLPDPSLAGTCTRPGAVCCRAQPSSRPASAPKASRRSPAFSPFNDMAAFARPQVSAPSP